MGLETGTYINDLVTSNPVGATDPKSQGDDHLRLIKSVLKTTFPNADRVFRFDVAGAAKTANYAIVAADQRALITFDATSGDLEATIIAIASLFPGWLVTIMKVDSSTNVVTVNPNGTETVNGAPTYELTSQYEFITLMVQGSEFKIVGTNSGNAIAGGTFPATVYGGGDIGDVKATVRSTPPTGWLMLNGDSLGSSASSATHKGLVYKPLFVLLWDTFDDTKCPVSAGRGASAEDDWTANKSITMLNAKNRMIVGAGTAANMTEAVSAGDVSTANDTFTVVSNVDKWITGMQVQVSTSGTLPSPLTPATNYYIIRASATTIKLATSLANAIAGTNIDLTTAGSGTHTLIHTLPARTAGDVGGEATHANTQAESASHVHDAGSLGTAASGSHDHSIVTSDGSGATGSTTFRIREASDAFVDSYNTNVAGSHSHGISGNTGSVGGDEAHNNMPPWIAFNWIIRY